MYSRDAKPSSPLLKIHLPQEVFLDNRERKQNEQISPLVLAGETKKEGKTTRRKKQMIFVYTVRQSLIDWLGRALTSKSDARYWRFNCNYES